MKKVLPKPIEIQFTGAEIAAVKEEFYSDVKEELIRDIVAIDVPLIVLRFMVKACIEEIIAFDLSSTQSSYSAREGMFIEILDRTVKKTEKQLNNMGQKGTELVMEITNEVKKDRLDSAS